MSVKVGQEFIIDLSKQSLFLTVIHFFFRIVQAPGARYNSVIPGYKGHVPRVKVNNQYLGKRITEQSREVFREEILDKAENNFSTTGYGTSLIFKISSTILMTVSIFFSFNANMIPKEDMSMEVRSRRYGTRTMFDTAKNH